MPPALPTLPLCRAAALWHSCPLVIDWHNFAHTLMALSLSPHHPAVSLQPSGLANLRFDCIHYSGHPPQLEALLRNFHWLLASADLLLLLHANAVLFVARK